MNSLCNACCMLWHELPLFIFISIVRIVQWFSFLFLLGRSVIQHEPKQVETICLISFLFILFSFSSTTQRVLMFSFYSRQEQEATNKNQESRIENWPFHSSRIKNQERRTQNLLFPSDAVEASSPSHAHKHEVSSASRLGEVCCKETLSDNICLHLHDTLSSLYVH